MSTLDAHAGAHHEEGSYFSGPPGMVAKIWQWATTVDHKKIGVMYLVAVLTMFFIGGVAALAVRIELLDPVRSVVTTEIVDGLETQVVSTTGQRLEPIAHLIGAENANEAYNRAFTLHGAVMVFMFIVPSIPASLGNFFLPIMLGAKDVAFPRLNLLSWYIYVIGSLFGVLSIIMGGVDTGWTFYTPYSTTTDADHLRVVLMVMAAFILGFSSILTGMNFVVTVHKLRAPGMGWFDMPLFIWGVYATSIIQVLATPVIGITLFLLLFERIMHIGIFDPAMGGDPVLY
ncbi:MAG: cbb3-type cytochrome c oxidase subunit I, partial [Phycisphaerales bacterium]|nr:cbb3-type cytochrome c oxidase subunit I [Phycisphaerales bacterium]